MEASSLEPCNGQGQRCHTTNLSPSGGPCRLLLQHGRRIVLGSAAFLLSILPLTKATAGPIERLADSRYTEGGGIVDRIINYSKEIFYNGVSTVNHCIFSICRMCKHATEHITNDTILSHTLATLATAVTTGLAGGLFSRLRGYRFSFAMKFARSTFFVGLYSYATFALSNTLWARNLDIISLYALALAPSLSILRAYFDYRSLTYAQRKNLVGKVASILFPSVPLLTTSLLHKIYDSFVVGYNILNKPSMDAIIVFAGAFCTLLTHYLSFSGCYRKIEP